ncbi:MAG TPA: hypothetical protein VEB86_01250 [Chryseosolibacter sp.]|nr:hypothetical protein [Chryseosolibacter sp.]
MKKNRWIFFALFALFHFSAFIFTIILDNNTNLLFKMVGWVWSFKWITLIGLLLFIVDVVWAVSVYKEHKREKDALNHEINTLKAKLFDMQEATKLNAPPSPRTNV